MTIRRDEHGAALVLAIVFMVVIGAIGGAVLSMLTSGLSNRVTLDRARDREYAADGAIQAAVAKIRAIPASQAYSGPGQPCPAIPDHTLNNDNVNVTIHTDCVPAPATTRDLIRQFDVIFATCDSGDVSAGVCPEAKVIIRAQINFQAVGSGADLTIQRTWVQAWSVNG